MSRTYPIAMAVATVLVVAGCTAGTATDSASTSSTVTQAESPSPTATVESASPGAVAGAQHPKSNCDSRDDVTANARIYNNLTLAPVRDFRDEPSDAAKQVWMRQDAKQWDNNDTEGEWGCARPPMAVKNGTDQTYYYYDGSVWSGHPGWWGHQEDFDWADDPSGYVWWRCSGGPVGGWGNACPDAALKDGRVKAPWDTRDNDDNTVKSRPSCESTNSVIGCYTDSYHNSGYDWDFVFDTYAWTAPMRLSISTTMNAGEGLYAPTGEKKAVSRPLYIAWKIANAELSDGAKWVNEASPREQIVRIGTGNSLVVGAYARARNGGTSATLRLVPSYFTDKDGKALECKAGLAATECTYVAEGKSPGSISGLLDRDLQVTITVSLALQDVSGNAGPPSVKDKSPAIACKSNFTVLNTKNLKLNCENASGEAFSSFTYGASWIASLTT